MQRTLQRTNISNPAMRSIAAALKAARGRAQIWGLIRGQDFATGPTFGSSIFPLPGERPGPLWMDIVRFGAGTLTTLATLASSFSAPTFAGTRKNSVESSGRCPEW